MMHLLTFCLLFSDGDQAGAANPLCRYAVSTHRFIRFTVSCTFWNCASDAARHVACPYRIDAILERSAWGTAM